MSAAAKIAAPLFREAKPGERHDVDVVRVFPEGFPDLGVFDEVAATLLSGFAALGYAPALRDNNVRAGVATILLGGHLVRPEDVWRIPGARLLPPVS